MISIQNLSDFYARNVEIIKMQAEGLTHLRKPDPAAIPEQLPQLGGRPFGGQPLQYPGPAGRR